MSDNDTLTFTIDRELKTELKMIALTQHRTVKEIMHELITDFVNKNKN